MPYALCGYQAPAKRRQVIDRELRAAASQCDTDLGSCRALAQLRFCMFCTSITCESTTATGSPTVAPSAQADLAHAATWSAAAVHHQGCSVLSGSAACTYATGVWRGPQTGLCCRMARR